LFLLSLPLAPLLVALPPSPSSLFSFPAPSPSSSSPLSLHDALPILLATGGLLLGRTLFAADTNGPATPAPAAAAPAAAGAGVAGDRKSTRLNSSHRTISYAVFCLKKKKKKKQANNVI